VGLGAFFLYKQLAARDQNDRQILLLNKIMGKLNEINTLRVNLLNK
jgi:hypothetical protein